MLMLVMRRKRRRRATVGGNVCVYDEKVGNNTQRPSQEASKLELRRNPLWGVYGRLSTATSPSPSSSLPPRRMMCIYEERDLPPGHSPPFTHSVLLLRRWLMRRYSGCGTGANVFRICPLITSLRPRAGALCVRRRLSDPSGSHAFRTEAAAASEEEKDINILDHG